MDNEAKISNNEWADLTHQVKENKEQIGYLKERTDKHSRKIDELEDNHIKLPMAIQQAVENGMAPVLEKVLKHDEMFRELALIKEREAKEQLLKAMEEEQERKRWFIRSVLGSVIAGIVGPALTILGYILFNNI